MSLLKVWAIFWLVEEIGGWRHKKDLRHHWFLEESKEPCGKELRKPPVAEKNSWLTAQKQEH